MSWTSQLCQLYEYQIDRNKFKTVELQIVSDDQFDISSSANSIAIECEISVIENEEQLEESHGNSESDNNDLVVPIEIEEPATICKFC